MTLNKSDVERELKSIVEDYFYFKTKDFSFNYYEEEEKKKELTEIICNSIEEIIREFRNCENDVDEFLKDYEFYRLEDLKEYEYNTKHSKY